MKNVNSVNFVKQALGLAGVVLAGTMVALPISAQVPVESSVDAMEEEMSMPEAEADMVVPTEAVEMPETEAPVEAEAPMPEATDEVAAADGTIVDIASESGAFDTLVAALTEADLTEVLAGEGPFTVFAPTDEAFAALPEGTVEQLLLPENREILIQILTYHVVPGTVMSDQLESGEVATVEGSSVNVVVGQETVTVNEANVVEADILATNGVIHVIDRVILPPALVQ